MEMTGEFRIPAPRQRVWEALNDPETLKQAIPGCQTIEKVSDTEFTAKVRAKVGPVSANFGGKVTLSDLDPPRAYTIAGEGNGGVAGFAKGSAKVNLDEDADATVLHYAVQAHVGGKLAQIGSRLIDSVARRMAENFFTRFVAAVAPDQAVAGSGTTAETVAVSQDRVAEPPVQRVAPTASLQAAPNAAAALAAKKEMRLPPAVWVTGLVAIVGAMLYFFTGRGVPR